jgi:tripartite-type tricarboxylate transporter receptor subunit TctC
MKILLRMLAAGNVALLAAVANADPNDAYPSRPITMIVPFAAGSGTDTATRVVAQYLGLALKQSIVVEDRPGANGGIAAAYVARAAPDGYTLFSGTNSPLSANPSLTKNFNYDPIKDFAPISRTGRFTLMLVVNPEVPAKSIAELVAYAKANPGKLSYASGDTSGIVAGATLRQWMGVEMAHIPYKSVPPALNDVLGGRVSMMFTDLTPGLPHVRANTLRALAVTSLKRSPLLPDLPSLDEAGITNFDIDAWAGLFAPAGTDKEVIARISTDVRQIIADPNVKAQLAAIGFEALASTPEEFGQFVKVQLGEWARMIKAAGIEPE